MSTNLDNIINKFIARKSLPAFDECRIRSFVKLRNDKTHSGEINWGNNGETFVILLALLYACVLKKAEVDSSIIHQLLVNLF